MRSKFTCLALSFLCLSVFSKQLPADGHLTQGMLNIGGIAVGVYASLGEPTGIDLDSVDLQVTYALAAYMAQLRSSYAGIQTLDTCGDRVVFNPPQLMIVEDSTEVAIGSKAFVEDWTCSSRTRVEQHGFAWTTVNEVQRSRTATTASMAYSVSLLALGAAMVPDTTIDKSGEPTPNSIIAMTDLAIAVSSDISGASEIMTWWDASAESSKMVASMYGPEEYKAFLEAFSSSDITIEGDTVRLSMEMSPAQAEGWATFIAAGPQALTGRND